MTPSSLIEQERHRFHQALSQSVLKFDKNGIPTNADKDNKTSVNIANAICSKLQCVESGSREAGQTSGARFEEICHSFLVRTFPVLQNVRPGIWTVETLGNRNRAAISKFHQFSHLSLIAELAIARPELAAAIGSDYLVTPDIVIYRTPEPDSTINKERRIIGNRYANLTPLRAANGEEPILHASISCKWTMRSDRAQNTRSEALNLIRNRKGKLPHVVALVCEPLPSRVASLALGTGDLDCVYHFALPELQEAVIDLGLEDAQELLTTMVEGRRLRDISDLPLDLAV